MASGDSSSWLQDLLDWLPGTGTVGPDEGEAVGEFVASTLGPVVDPATTAARAADFFSDPPGWLLEQLETFTSWLAGSVMPSLVQATKPDLSAEWFLSAYAVTFGLAFFVMAVLSILNLVRLASGSVASADVVDALTYQGVWFFLGSSLGPLVGYMVAQVVGAASDALLGWAVQDSVEGVVARLQEFADTERFLPEAGGWLLAVAVLLFLIIGLVLVVLAHLIALVTLYFVGVLFPLTQVWRMDPKRRSLADSAVMVWLCILASHALVFLLLGIAFHWVGDAGFAFLADPGMNSVAQALAAGFAMILAGISPMMLFKLAKVLPSTAGQAGPSLPAGAGSSGSGQSKSLSDHAQQQQASTTESAPSGGEGSDPASSGVQSQTGEPGEQPGALEQQAKDHRSGFSSAGASDGGQPSTPASGGDGAGTVDAARGASTGASGAGGAGAGAGGAGAGAGGAGATGTAAVAEGAATGGTFGPIGAAVGAGLGMAAAGVKKAWDTTVDTSERVGETASQDMGREEGN